MEGLYSPPFMVRLKPGDTEFRRGRVKCRETLPNVNGIKYRFLKSCQRRFYLSPKQDLATQLFNVVQVPFLES